MSSTDTSVALLGATGLVGGHCLRYLAASEAFDRIVVLTRRPLPEATRSARIVPRSIDFERSDSFRPHLDVGAVICCLGTTIGKAGSREAFRRVDHDYPLAVATTARERGARHFLLVSSLGADPVARNFYLRVKGELEAAILSLGFDRVTIVRPSLLRGDRVEPRIGERLALGFGFLFPRRYRPIDAARVASVLAGEAANLEAGKVVLESEQMQPGSRSHSDSPR